MSRTRSGKVKSEELLVAEEPQLEDADDAPASFEGKLNLSSFGFSCSLTKSQNISSQTSQSPSKIPASCSRSMTPLKRTSSTLSTSSSASSKKPRSQLPASYAPPSKYAHLPELRDTIAPNLILLFIGLNPGIETARSGNPYAHPSNLFWKLLHSSGLTPRRYLPSEHKKLPGELSLGNTNIVARPTKNGAELSKGEMDESVEVLEEKIRQAKPEAVCIVGKSIWESVWRVKHRKALRKEEFRYGWQEVGENMGKGEGWQGAKVFVATSTSGLAAGMKPAEKQIVWNEVGEWVKKRREERAAEVATGADETEKGA